MIKLNYIYTYKIGIIVQFQNDSYEQKNRISGNDFHYEVKYNDGSTNTYEAQINFDII